jgi:methylglutaconyl-CoA hydratase
VSDATVHRSDDDRGVVTLRIDAPTTRNALSTLLLGQLDDELGRISEDPSVRVVVISGTGTAFSSGADRSELGDPDSIDRVTELTTAVIERIDQLPLPVICRVNGDAYGAGLALLAVADLSISVRKARFGLPEPHFGLVATLAAAACVPRIGESASLDLLLTGRSFDAVEAQRIGLVAAVVAAADLEDTVDQRIGAVLLGAPVALGVTKQLVRRLGGPSLHDRLKLAQVLGRDASAQESKEGHEAMILRRSPKWVPSAREPVPEASTHAQEDR